MNKLKLELESIINKIDILSKVNNDSFTKIKETQTNQIVICHMLIKVIDEIKNIRNTKI